MIDGPRLGTGGATAGAGVLATCMCSTAKFTLGGFALGGALIALNLHTAFFTAAAGLVLSRAFTGARNGISAAPARDPVPQAQVPIP